LIAVTVGALLLIVIACCCKLEGDRLAYQDHKLNGALYWLEYEAT
jgi:hypothetical protein